MIPRYLPFASDALDVVLLPHTLERVAEPEQVLREAERVLRGEGHVLVLGFHPWGPWGLARLIRRRPELGRAVPRACGGSGYGSRCWVSRSWMCGISCSVRPGVHVSCWSVVHSWTGWPGA